MRLRPLFLPLLVATSTLVLASCATYDDGATGGRPYAPEVLIPTDLNANESRLIAYVEDSLSQAGFRPSSRSSAEYALQFSVEDGPINADVNLALTRHGRTVAEAYARTGGPRIVLQRQQVIRESFDKALRQFESQLPSPRGAGYAEEEPQTATPYWSSDYRRGHDRYADPDMIRRPSYDRTRSY